MFGNVKSAILAAVILGGSMVPASAASLDYLFNIRLGVAKIGEMRVKSTDASGQYSASGALYTTGIAGALYDVRFDSAVSGTVASSGQYLPVSYTSESYEDGKTTSAAISYSGPKVANVSYTPSKPVSAGAVGQADTIDPMTLIYLLIRPVSMDHICGGAYDLFDGGTRLRVTYTNPRKYNDGRVECSVAYDGGAKAGGIVPTSVIFKPGSDGMMHIRQFSAQTNLGVLVATLR